MIGCLQRDITGCLQKKNGYHYLSLNLYVEGKRKPKMINTGLPTKGYHQREAESRLEKALSMFNDEGKTLEEVMEVVQGEAFKKKPKPVAEPKTASPTHFLRPELVDELEIETPRRCEDSVTSDAYKSIMDNEGKESRRIRFGNQKRRGDEIQVADYLRYWAKIPRRNIEKGTMNNYRRHIEMRIVPYFEFFDVTLTELESYDVTMFYEYCLHAGRLDGSSGPVSPSTIHRVHSALHLALNEAKDKYGLIQSNPASGADAPKNNKYPHQLYSPQQVNLFLKAAVGDILAIPCIMLFCLGLRRGEALGIKENVVFLDEKQVEIRHQVVMEDSKVVYKDYLKTSNSHRVLPISSEMADALRYQLERNRRLRYAFGPKWNPEGYLFVYDDGRVIHPHYFSKHFKRIAIRAGLPPIRLHDSRHTNITIGMQQGNNALLMKEHSGHADVKTTELYTHWLNEDMRKITDSISRIIQVPEMNIHSSPVLP